MIWTRLTPHGLRANPPFAYLVEEAEHARRKALAASRDRSYRPPSEAELKRTRTARCRASIAQARFNAKMRD